MLLNCDLGEWETAEETDWMMARIQLANVACGWHAGSPGQIVLCKQLGEKYRVECGIHPGVRELATLHEVDGLLPQG